MPVAVVNGYVTAQALADYLSLGTVPAGITADALADAINAASRKIDGHCGRRFYSSTSSVRSFYSPQWREVAIDDAQAVTVVKLDTAGDGTWATTLAGADYYTLPRNSIGETGEPWPITGLAVVGSTPIPCTDYERPNVQVTATWGWAAVPEPIRQATLIVAAEHFKLREAPFGVAGFADYGAVRVREMPHVGALLTPYNVNTPGFA